MEKTNEMGDSEDQDMVISSTTSSSPTCDSETEELQRLENMPPFWRNPNMKKKLSKQLSMCETTRDMAWERRRRQFLRQERRRNGIPETENLTDEDLNELKGCIELGFGFNEDKGQKLRTTIPALNLYFAVNRQFSTSPLASPASTASAPSLDQASTSTSSTSIGGRASSVGSPMSDSDSWKICSPGDDPEQVKTKLRHWAQVVACSVMQSS